LGGAWRVVVKSEVRPRAADLAVPPLGLIEDLARALGAFVETAVTIAHLAGAPAWEAFMLLPSALDWGWLRAELWGAKEALAAVVEAGFEEWE
jgi:hypothetical protein